jgi:hypothetical protein
METQADTQYLLWSIALFVIAVAVCSVGTYLFQTSKDCKGERRVWSIIFFVVTFVLAFPTIISGFYAIDTVKNDAVSQETALNTQYVQNQNVLSTYVSSYLTQLGIANLQSDRIRQIIVDAIAGQGLVKDSKDPQKSPLFLALAQAYPNVTLSQYNQLISYIEQGRQSFQNAQSTLLTKLGAFDAWRESGFLFHPWLVSLTGAPNDVLNITVGGKKLTGAAAEEQMWKIVRDPVAVADTESGIESSLRIK